MVRTVSPRRVLASLSLLVVLGSVLSCDLRALDRTAGLREILARGRIVMITQNSANTYYLYRDRPHGFEYELARAFADHLGVALEVVTPGWSEMFELLRKGEGDFIAAGVTILPSREDLVDFSIPYLTVRQRVITHRETRGVRKVEDLVGRTVHVRAETSYQQRLAELVAGGTAVRVVPIPDVPTEELIRRVAEKEIEITVADSNIALLNRRYHPEIRIGFPLSEKQFLGWAVRPGNRELLAAINEFLVAIREGGEFDHIYDHYYEDRDILGRVDLQAFRNKVRTRLPRYETLIREEAQRHGFDWRFLAAVIYQESHFNPRARSHTGVRGLMQVTLVTAREMGIADRLDPKLSVQAGARYLAQLRDRFDDIPDRRDRLLFALASYNIGYGHVMDARQIAREKGLDPDKWESLREVLPLLRQPEYYRRTRYGYARGTEPVRYVEHVLTYYDILRQEEVRRTS